MTSIIHNFIKDQTILDRQNGRIPFGESDNLYITSPQPEYIMLPEKREILEALSKPEDSEERKKIDQGLWDFLNDFGNFFADKAAARLFPEGRAAINFKIDDILCCA